MPISISELAAKIRPDRTVLFFGAGSSIPSGAPSVSKIIERLASAFEIDADGYSLSEMTSFAEQKKHRKEVIKLLRSMFSHTTPTGSLLNLPLYDWKNIYTTNYDTLIEQSYAKKERDLTVISSNFDFTVQSVPEAIKLFKLHGTIDKDESDGIHSRIVISENDYDMTTEYREFLYDALKADIAGSDLVIIGYSLSDQHIKDIITRALDINSKIHNPSTIYLLLYTRDENRASLHEKRGIKVAFGGLDDFFVEMHKNCDATTLVYSATGDPLDVAAALRPITKDVAHEIKASTKDASAMFNGWPANYADIAANLTFTRTLGSDICKVLDDDRYTCVVLLGASGTGKTTLAKQVLYRKSQNNTYCWEHKSEHTLLADRWKSVADSLKEGGAAGGSLY